MTVRFENVLRGVGSLGAIAALVYFAMAVDPLASKPGSAEAAADVPRTAAGVETIDNSRECGERISELCVYL